MRFFFLNGGLPDLTDAVDGFAPSGPCYLTRADADEHNTLAGDGLPGVWRHQIHMAVERHRMPTSVRRLESGPGNAPGRLGF